MEILKFNFGKSNKKKKNVSGNLLPDTPIKKPKAGTSGKLLQDQITKHKLIAGLTCTDVGCCG